MTTPAPSVPVFLAGFGPQKSDMQSLWVNPLAFFQQRVVLRATQTSGATTLPSSGAVTTIAYNNIIEDPYAGWNAGTHQWLAPFSGWYQVTVTVWVTAPGALQIVLEPYVQSTSAGGNLAQGVSLAAVILPSAAAGAAECTWYVYLTGGLDSAYGAASVQNSGVGVTTDLTAGQNSSIEIIWVTS